MRKPIAIIPVLAIYALLSSFTGKPAETKPASPGVPFITKESSSLLYYSLDLKSKGLSKKAFDHAYKGYMRLLRKKIITNPQYLTICDLSQASVQKRLYVIDMDNQEVVIQTYVAHGMRSGMKYASRFSNKTSSHQSSLGFYITKSVYKGENGLSLRLQGLEPGFNDRALRRAIVIHGANYIGDGLMGRSFGCPAVPEQDNRKLIETIKEGNCLFIYHPSKNYLLRSKILNG